jgi:hypothetical protein
MQEYHERMKSCRAQKLHRPAVGPLGTPQKLPVTVRLRSKQNRIRSIRANDKGAPMPLRCCRYRSSRFLSQPSWRLQIHRAVRHAEIQPWDNCRYSDAICAMRMIPQRHVPSIGQTSARLTSGGGSFRLRRDMLFSQHLKRCYQYGQTDAGHHEWHPIADDLPPPFR